VHDYDDDVNAKQNEKETQERSAESPVTEKTDESAVKSKRERNTNNLRKSEESDSAVLMKYILENKAEHPQETDAIDSFLSEIAVTPKSLSSYYQNIAKQNVFSTFWFRNAANRECWFNK
jgi:hypothetical protein